MCYTASQLFLAPGLYLPTFLIATLMRPFFNFPCLFTKKTTSSLVVKHLAEFFHLKLLRFRQILQKQTNSGSYMGCVRYPCTACNSLIALYCWCVPAGEENCSRTLLQPSVMMNDCFPTRLHSVSLETEHLNTLASSPGKKGRRWKELGKHETNVHTASEKINVGQMLP